MKLRAYKLDSGYKGDRFCFLCHGDDVGRMQACLDTHKPETLLELDIKQWKPKRTMPQLRMYWDCLTDFAHKTGVYDDTAIKHMHEGIKQKYAYRQDTGLYEDDGTPIRTPIGLSECDRFEQFEVLFNGIFMEAESQGVDMSDWVLEYQKLKEAQKEAVT